MTGVFLSVMLTIIHAISAVAPATDKRGEVSALPIAVFNVPAPAFGAAIGPEDGRVSCFGGHGNNADDARMILPSSRNLDKART